MLDTLASGAEQAKLRHTRVRRRSDFITGAWTPGAGQGIVEVARQAESRAGRGSGAGEESEMDRRGSPRREWGGWSELDEKQAGQRPLL